MSTKMGFWRWALVGAALLITSGPVSAASQMRAGITTNEPAAILIYPDVEVDPDICFPKDPNSAINGGDGKCSVSKQDCAFTRGDVEANDEVCTAGSKDTIIQLTNTSNNFQTRVWCFWINANAKCDNAEDIICTEENFRDVCPRGGYCEPGWEKTDFRFNLTKRQPIAFSASDPGPLPCDEQSPEPCDNDQRNKGALLGVPEIPFHGELRCVQLVASDTPNDADIPTDQNFLKGEATILTGVGTPEDPNEEPAPGTDSTSNGGGPSLDARKYTAVGIPALPGRVGPDAELNIGGPEAEYGAVDPTDDGRAFGCPNVLMVDHFFDNANVITHAGEEGGKMYSHVTFVPCGADLTDSAGNLSRSTTLQFLVYNEFEQRFSTSTKLNCYKETKLSNIDTRPEDWRDDRYSIFSANVQGTLTGVSHIRPVAGQNVDGYDGRGVIALLEEFWQKTDNLDGPDYRSKPSSVRSTAANVQFRGVREQGDKMILGGN